MNHIIEIAEFVLPRFRFAWSNDTEKVYKWIDWHWDHGFICRAFNESNELVGVLVIRPVIKAEDGAEHYAYDPEGSVIFVDLLVCDDARALRALWAALLKRFGYRNSVAWSRNGAPIKTYAVNKMDRRLATEEIYGR